MSTNEVPGGTLAATGQKRGGPRIVSIATGMNYWNGQAWVPSDPTFDEVEGAFVAERVQNKVRLAAENLNQEGAVMLRTPDGIVLRSTPVAIGLYDAASGESTILASIRGCPGVLVSSNQAVFENVFNENGVQADAIYTIEAGTFSQDIVFSSPLNVSDYGFPEESTRIQIFTEFYGPPQPDRVTRPIRVEQNKAVRGRMASPDLVGETLGFGEFDLATGRARRIGEAASSGDAAAPIVKEFGTIQGRTFLIESVEYSSIKNGPASPERGPEDTGFAQAMRSKKSSVYSEYPQPVPLNRHRH